MTNTITTSVTNISSINCHSKKVSNYYIWHKVLLAIKLLLRITIIWYHYAKHTWKQKSIDALAI